MQLLKDPMFSQDFRAKRWKYRDLRHQVHFQIRAAEGKKMLAKRVLRWARNGLKCRTERPCLANKTPPPQYLTSEP